ncbi:endonuclease III [Chitinophaga lutea]|uniref:Endonuclease III n=1 Tax=Chitinophaga lutea TaxID=2488634 RepID=A0A3N4Q1L0_9BACT|nr:endonuclease III [Chitinophaga lutea]RPE14118.1 endonuclease III [Chitinophaga lutea]
MGKAVNWPEAIKPLIKKYKGQKHPLDYGNTYQLVVGVVLSAQDSDRNINKLGPALFEAFPNMQALSKATPEDLFPYINKIRNFGNKAKWLVEIAQTIKKDSNIPLTQATLTELPGIGRKSANVIMRESGVAPEGIIVDLHVVRVAPRLGIVTATDPVKIEKQLMAALPPSEWDAGMAMSFLGREICRPTPKCGECLMNPVCEYYQSTKSQGGALETVKQQETRPAGAKSAPKAKSAKPKEPKAEGVKLKAPKKSKS